MALQPTRYRLRLVVPIGQACPSETVSATETIQVEFVKGNIEMPNFLTPKLDRFGLAKRNIILVLVFKISGRYLKYLEA